MVFLITVRCLPIYAVCLLLTGCSKPNNTQTIEPTLPGSGSQESQATWFSDRREQWHLNHVYHSGHVEKHLFPEIIGGGGAAIDFDRDGWMDLYLVQGATWDETPSPDLRNRLFRNDGNGKFVDVSNGSGTDNSDYSMGAIAGDFDNDGWTDLYVTNLGPNVLFRNKGDGTFADVTQHAGVGDAGWGTSASFLDYDNDGWLDLYVCNYVHWSKERDIACFQPSGRPDYCSPKSYNAPQQDVLYRNNGDGTFTNVTNQSGISAAAGNGLGVLANDFNNDGYTDIFVANDMTYNILWINDGKGNFKNEALNYGCAVDRDGQEKAGMGVFAVDLKGSGKLDIFVANLAGQSDSFYENRGGFFADQTPQRGLAVDSRPFTRFGVGFHDFDRDGWLDIFIANGRVTMPDQIPASGDPFAEPNLLLRGLPNHRFERVPDSRAGDATEKGTSRAAVFADFDNDGSLEIVVVNKDGPAQFLANQLPDKGNWIGLRVFEANGQDALGAIVIVEANGASMRRHANPYYGYLASHDPRLLFGMGTESQASKVSVRWSDGLTQEFGVYPANQYHELKRSSTSKP